MASVDSAPQLQLLRAMYDRAVSLAHPDICVPPYLPEVPEIGRIIIVGAGKAAAAMALATERHYAALGLGNSLFGFVTTRHGYGLPSDIIPIMEAGHPVPDANSVASAKLAVQLARSAGPKDLVLCLLSGGASALWSAPVEGISFETKRSLTKLLLKSGARISEMNCVRKHLSQIKGGRLAAASYPARLITLAISDVPGDDPDAIGSGPTVPDPTTLAEAKSILERYKISVPDDIRKALSNSSNETLKSGDEKVRNSTYHLIATPKTSLEGAATIARDAGYKINILGDALEGEAREVGREHANLALEAKRKGERIAFISGGEFTVTVTGKGSGGPNQEYMMGVAIGLQGEPRIWGLAGDTDGIDGGGGNADDPAGAIITPDTLAKAKSLNLNPVDLLKNNDSTLFFRSLGDLLECGPTQTNVNDFRVLLVDP